MRTRYYSSYSDDFVQTKDQNCRVPEDYPWRSRGILPGLVYTAAILFSTVYCRLFLHIRYKNSRALRSGRKTGGFIYCNHTQPLGDVFIPALPVLPGRIYTVVSPANLAIPVIGKILPYLGALPIPDSLQGMKALHAAMEYRLQQKRFIAVFPEAHVWEYYTGIRPFPDTSFKYPVKFQKPVYAMTVTYQKRRFCKRPKATVFLDGPFYPDASLSPKAQAAALHDTVYNCMCRRSKQSNCDYIKYEHKP